MREAHIKLKHAGVDTIINEVRKEYWVISLRRVAKEVVKECMNCQRVLAKPCNQEGAPLPKDRITQRNPFKITGVDYAGPLYVNDQPESKLYICLFTCATIRAVHLEVTDSLTTRDFVCAFRRFVARRGIPETVYSDNAKTFKSALQNLNSIYKSQTPEWKFIAPRAPWWGGFWERMVRNIKSALKKCLANAVLSKGQLITLVTEVEYAVNSRPLTQVVDDINSIRAITPNDFLMCYGHEEDLLMHFNEGRSLLRKFWKIWSNNYLKNLPKCVAGFRQKGNLSIGDIVLIQEDNITRMQWPLGQIVQLFNGKDGKVRSAEVRIKNGTLIRPIQRLCILEAARSSELEKLDSGVEGSAVQGQKTVTVKFITDEDL